MLFKLAEANLAKLPGCSGLGIFLKACDREIGPLSEFELMKHIQDEGLSPEQAVRIGGASEWHLVKEFFPNQFPSVPRRIGKAG